MYKVQFTFEMAFDLSQYQDKARSEFERLIQEAAVRNNSHCFHSGFGCGQRDLCYEFEIHPDAVAFCDEVNCDERIAEEWLKFNEQIWEHYFYAPGLLEYEEEDFDEKEVLSEIVRVARTLRFTMFYDVFCHTFDEEEEQGRLLDAWLENWHDKLQAGNWEDKRELLDLHENVIKAARAQK